MKKRKVALAEIHNLGKKIRLLDNSIQSIHKWCWWVGTESIKEMSWLCYLNQMLSHR